MAARSQSSNGKTPSRASDSPVEPGTSNPLDASGTPSPPRRRTGWFSRELDSVRAAWRVVGAAIGPAYPDWRKGIRFAAEWAIFFVFVSFCYLAGPIGALLFVSFLVAVTTTTLWYGLMRHYHEASHQFATKSDRIIEMIEEITRRLDGQVIVHAQAGIDPGVLAIERALDAGDGNLAGSLIEALALARPDDPALAVLTERLAQVRQAAARDLAEELQAARAAGDVDRVLELHAALAPSLEHEARTELDRDLAGWFLDRIQRRLRGGKIQLEVVELASKVADGFAATVAGASLRQSLPMLRRSVGLCPRCAQPYLGVAQACPVCLAAGSPIVPAQPATPISTPSSPDA